MQAISHLIHRDYEAIVNDFVTLQFIPKGGCIPPQLLRSDMKFHLCMQDDVQHCAPFLRTIPDLPDMLLTCMPQAQTCLPSYLCWPECLTRRWREEVKPSVMISSNMANSSRVPYTEG